MELLGKDANQPLVHGTKPSIILANFPGLFLCPLFPIILFFIFECCPGLWSNSCENFEMFVFLRYQDFRNGSQYTHRIGRNSQQSPYRLELSAPLGREEGTETEVSHHWLTIQYICLLSETSIKIHIYWLRELMKCEEMVMR